MRKLRKKIAFVHELQIAFTQIYQNTCSMSMTTRTKQDVILLTVVTLNRYSTTSVYCYWYVTKLFLKIWVFGNTKHNRSYLLKHQNLLLLP